MALKSLKLLDYSDKELIGVVSDMVGPDGWARTNEVTKQLGLKHERPTQCVGARLAWLKRYGIVEGGDRKWRLTPVGEVFLNGQLSKKASDALERMEAGELFTVTRFLARQQRNAAAPVGHMLRREWVHGTGRR